MGDAAVTDEAGERVRTGEKLQVARVERGTPCQVIGIVKRPLHARSQDARDRQFTQTLDARESKPHRRLVTARLIFVEGAVSFTDSHIDRSDLDAVTLGILDQLGWS